MSEERDKQLFDARATTPDGKEVMAQGVKAASARQLVQQMEAQGLQVSELRAAGPLNAFESRAFSADEFAVFNSELAAAAKCNAPLPGALRAISGDLGRPGLRAAVERLAVDIEQGRDLADALADQPKTFPPAYVTLVRAGLASGNLAGTLLLFAEERRMTSQVQRNTKMALVYPMFVLLAASVLACMVSWTILPLVEGLVRPSLFASRLPFIVKTMLFVAPLMRVAPLVVLGLLGVGFLVWKLVARRIHGAALLGKMVLGLPLFGSFLGSVAVSRFCRMLAGALRNKVPVPDAVELAGLATGNAVFQDAARRAAEAVREGCPISEALASSGRCFPTALTWSLSLGQERGDIAEALEEHARFQDENADRLGRLVPALTITMVTVASSGLLILTVVSVMGPMLQAIISFSDGGM